MAKDIKIDIYKNIVRFTLNSMKELAAEDRHYNLRADLEHYYENKIIPDGRLSKDEFMELCESVGIKT